MNAIKYLILLLLLGQSGMLSDSKIYGSYCASNNFTSFSGAELTTRNVNYSSGFKTECLDNSGNIIETSFSYILLPGGTDMNILGITYGDTFSTELNATINMLVSPNTMIGTGSFTYPSQNVSLDFTFPLTQGVTDSEGSTYYEPTTLPVTFTISDTEYTGEFDLSNLEPSTDLYKDGNVVGHVKIDQSSQSNIPVFKTYKYVSGNLVEL